MSRTCFLVLAASAVILVGCGGDDPAPAAPETATPPGARRPAQRPAQRPTNKRPRPERAPERPLPRAPVRAEAVQEGPRKGRRIALTFDADMTSQMLEDLEAKRVESWYERRIIRTLRKTRTPATLFLTGLWAKVYSRETSSLASDGLFEIASHTFDHLAWTGDCYGLPTVEGDEAKRAEVTRTARILDRPPASLRAASPASAMSRRTSGSSPASRSRRSRASAPGTHSRRIRRRSSPRRSSRCGPARSS